MYQQITEARPLLLVGCGNMGRALLAGWLRQGLTAERLWIIEPKGPSGLPSGSPVGAAADRVVAQAADLPADLHPRTVVLAVKPQVMPVVLTDLRRFGRPDTLFLSIAAGVRIDAISEGLGGNAAVIRAIPNTPASIGKGISAIVRNAAAGEDNQALAEALLAAAGEVVWVDDEDALDAVTALSGSGPAYVFYLVEALTAAGIDLGLEHDMAARLAKQTIVGAGALLEDPEADPATLRANVTSPKGTTEAALAILMQDPGGLAEIISRAVAAAAARSEELSHSR